MPEGYRGWARRADHLTADELVRVVEAATEAGFRKFRLTGGEPLIRRDIVDIARRIWYLTGVQTLAISTNGTHLAGMAGALKKAGVRSVNISLDSLDPLIYRTLTGGSLEGVLDGIDAALSAGFEVVKLNCVLLRGVNESQIRPLVEYGASKRMPVRFIELMPLGPGGPLGDSHFMPVSAAMDLLGGRELFVPATTKPPGHGPARYYRYQGNGALVGFIGSVSCEDFCATCNKLRLTANGKLRPCLGRHGEIDIMPGLRAAAPDDGAVVAAIRAAIANKPENHAFAEGYVSPRPMTAIGG